MPGHDPLAEGVAALARRHALDQDAAARLTRLGDALRVARWAPTTVRDPQGIADRHLADSLAALDLPEVRAARTIADLGAGAGFPGLALAAALPETEVTCLDSAGRKAAFMADLAAAAGLANARAVAARAEEWRGGPVNLVTARALASLPVVLEYAAPLLREGGVLVAWRGRRDPAEEAQAARAAHDLGLGDAEVYRTAPFPAATDHHLHRYVKRGPTPGGFPRRPGMARKRPLGHGLSDRAER